MKALRQIPPVNDILCAKELSEFRGLLGQPLVLSLLDRILGDTRRELGETTSVISRSDLTSRIARELARQLGEVLKPSLRRVINASGVVLHTNLGRAPLPSGAMNIFARFQSDIPISSSISRAANGANVTGTWSALYNKYSGAKPPSW